MLDLSTRASSPAESVEQTTCTSSSPYPVVISVSEDSQANVSSTQSPEKKKKSRAVPLPPCKVCGGTSTGYHFGVITCEACKAFFRRALIHKQEYKCARDNSCNIVDKKQGNCSACRLKKCFELGMSKGGVRKGRYSIALRTNAIVEAKASAGKQVARSGPLKSLDDVFPTSSSSHYSTAVPSPLDDLLRASDIARANAALTAAEPGSHQPNIELELLIEALIGCQDAVYPNLKRIHEISMLDAQRRSYQEHQLKQQMFLELFGKPSTLSVEDYQQIFAETGIDLDDRLAHFNLKGKAMEEAIAQYVNFAKIIPGFKNLNPKDVSRLLKASHLEFWVFGNYMLFNNELEVAISWDGSHNTTKTEICKFCSRQWVEEMFKFSDRIQRLGLSLEEIALIRVIILTYTDRCNLSDRAKIQVLQDKYLDCLLYHLRKTSTRPHRRLYKIFNILLAMRDFTELNIKENMEFLAKWEFIIHEFPLWKEMLSYREDM